MTFPPRALALLALAIAALGFSCARPAPVDPDVVLISVDALDWSELSIEGGPVSSPRLAEFADASVRFENMATLAPGGAPAAATLLTGEPPLRHGLRRLGQGALAADVATLADRLLARGWATGAFLQASDLPVSMQLDRGFEAYDAPPEIFPSGHPRIARHRSLPETIGAGISWLRILDLKKPAFLWIHLPDPAPPGDERDERVARLGELDRFVGTLRDRMLERGRLRGRAPVLVFATLRGQGDPAATVEDAYLLKEPALRVRAFVEAGGVLAPSAVKDLAGLDEIAPLAASLTLGGQSRLRDLAAGGGDARELVVAETLVPLTSLRAMPVKAGVRPTMMAAPTEEPIVAAVASDPEWPGGEGRVGAIDTVATYLAIDSAWNDLQQGRAAQAVAEFRSLVRGGSAGAAPGARVGFGLALLATDDAAGAREQFAALESESAPAEFAWEQALLGQAAAARQAGDAAAARAALERLVEANRRDLRALTWLAAARAEAGDPRGAVAALLDVLAIDPDHPDALEAISRLRAQSGDADAAAESADAALRRRPTSSPLLLTAARAHLARGDAWTALDRVDRHVSIFGASIESNLMLADVYEATQRWDLAAEFLKRALERSPLDVRLILRAARIQLTRGDEEDARGLIARAEQLQPASAEACVLWSRWLASRGRREEAAAAARDCATRHPAAREAAALLAELAAP